MSVTNDLIKRIPEVGSDLGTTRWVEIDQARINAFADVTHDWQWIHVDPERAAHGPFGSTVAHGYLTLSLIGGFLPELLLELPIAMGLNYGLNRVRFPEPVRVGSRVRANGTLIASKRIADGAQLTIRITIEVEGATRPACVAEVLLRFLIGEDERDGNATRP